MDARPAIARRGGPRILLGPPYNFVFFVSFCSTLEYHLRNQYRLAFTLL
jgi:hypothetical protein